ncbi:MAG TPA: GntR family transcriptional regulator [Opitutaceae bacterium]|nr:GntR family transcriptional regulator [Opitutaceae bacterium]
MKQISLKHREISRQLLAEIAAGKYYPSGRLPSEAQLVKRFCVSRPTVARALRDLQTDGLIERRAGSGSYIRQRSGKLPVSRQLGLLVPGRSSTEIFEVICGELASLARSHEYGLLFGGSALPHHDPDLSERDAIKLCDQFIEQRVMGVFFAPFEQANEQEAVNRRIAEDLRKAGIPVILLDRDLTAFPRHSEFDVVGIDNVSAGFLMAEHLIKLGCSDLAFVSRPHSAPTVDARITGVRLALAENRIEPSLGWTMVGDPQDQHFARSVTAKRRWDAVICANDLTAAQFMRALEEIHVRVPQDIRVVGFDDVKYATLLKVPLTTVNQPCRDLAITAFRAMVERMAEPTLPGRSLLLAPRIVVRESCGAYLRQSRK